MKTTLLLIFTAAIGTGCVGFKSVVAELKHDPAMVDLEFQGWGASIKLHRSFPTNWTPPTPLLKP